MPYEHWSGFAYCELHWSPCNFWNATAWDVVSAMIFHNKKYASDKKPINKKELTEFRENMKIKGVG